MLLDLNFVRGLSFMDILILATAQDERSFDVLVKGAKDTKMEGQKGLFRIFSGPWLA